MSINSEVLNSKVRRLSALLVLLVALNIFTIIFVFVIGKSGLHFELARQFFGNSNRELIMSWHNFFEYIEGAAGCTNLKIFGGQLYRNTNMIDGNKAVCLDENIAPTPGACTVLSFGINNEWSFDDAMEEYGCKVFAFDPTMQQPAHTRGRDIHFQPWGLGGITGIKNKIPVLTYRDILKKIRKEDSIIDYLKIDIEGFELDFFENVLDEDVELLANIKQIGMEIHPGRSVAFRNKIWSQIRQLRSLNFSQTYSQPNLIPPNAYKFENKTVSNCYEILWCNENFR
ncbi:uncharacterized protein LOC108665009 [Hyalella azteca]|uniref:Uncharacterized protein LOC108665009 n=1 Tax=Hyalella azteca TaxID=294128 RepID=A0A8B7N1W1_HYAAZ|nr:uncharacterized protein LOC108665009 [Hyalella azteca]